METKESDKKPRFIAMDNVKAGLICLVVFGHMLELVTSRLSDMLYIAIYLFHMPLFVFCTGYFAKFSPKKMVTVLIPLYLIFQAAYILFARHALGQNNLPMQFTTPHWIMWYMLALIVWSFTLPILEKIGSSRKRMITTLIAAFALALLAGFDNTIGYYLSLSRIIYFYPFFLLGYFAKRVTDHDNMFDLLGRWRVRLITGLLGTAIGLFLIFFPDFVDNTWVFGAFSYQATAHTGYNVLWRMAIYAAAIIISVFGLSVCPRKQWFFTFIGGRTLMIFLLHGFIMQLMHHFEVIRYITFVFNDMMLRFDADIPMIFLILSFVAVVSAVIVLVLALPVFSPGSLNRLLKE